MVQAGSGLKPRVVFVLPDFAGGGAQGVMLRLLAGVDRGRFQPEVVVLNGHGPLKYDVSADVPVHDLHRARLRQSLPRLIGALRRVRSTIIVSSLGYTNMAVLAFRSFLPSKPRILIREANTPSRSLSNVAWPTVYRRGYRMLYPTADLVICPTNQIKREMVDSYGVPESRALRLANPIDREDIRRKADSPSRFPGQGRRFVAGGRLTAQKGFDLLIKMLVPLADDTHLTIFGDGPELSNLVSLAERLGVSSCVRFAGFERSPWAAYAGADAFLLPSRWEGMSNAALEALACGTPVIAAPEAGGIHELVDEAKPGAVTIRQVGEPFEAAMRAVVPQPGLSLRPSLLPERFSLPAVNAAFGELLTKHAMA